MCGFVVSSCVLIFSVNGNNAINISDCLTISYANILLGLETNVTA